MAGHMRRIRSALAVGVWGGCALLLSSCQSTDVEYGKPDVESLELRQQAEAVRVMEVPMPEEIPELLPAERDRAAEEAAAAIPPLPTIEVENLDLMRDVDVAVLLRALAKGAGINLLIGDNVQGPIRLNLEQKTSWDRLFHQLMELKGLYYEWDGSVLKVMAQADVERQTAIEGALAQREAAREQRRQAEPLELGLYRVRYANSERLAESIKAGLGIKPETEGSVSIIPDSDSGLLILNAPARRIRQVLELAASLDQPARQILIEATIVQTNSETARDLGVQWGAYLPNEDSGRLQIGTGLDPTTWDGLNANFPADFSMGDAGFTFGMIRSTNNQVLRAQLSALQKDGRLKIVSSPSITTLDKQTALIESGEERPFQSSSGTGATTTPVVEFKEALLSLEVTPQVIDGRWIKLGIKTTKDDFDDTKAVLIDGTLQVPIITRSASTLLYLADGQTTVIGGLSTQSENDGETGIPFLKDLPLLGHAFRNTVNRSSFSDTLIFITPYILPSGVVLRERVEADGEVGQ